MSSETSRPNTPGSIGRGNIVLQRDFHGRLMLCDHIKNTMITAEDWIAHERIRIGQDVQPRHCEDYEVLTQIIDDVFHLQHQSYDNWMIENSDLPRITTATAATSNIINNIREKTKDLTTSAVYVTPLKKIDSSNELSGELSDLNTPNLSPTTADPLMMNNSQRNGPDSPDRSLPQTPSPVLSPTPMHHAVPQWKSPLHRLYAHCSKSADCINVSLELESLQKLCASRESTTSNVQAFKAILSNHVAALIQSVALDATDKDDFETMMDIRAELILFLEHNYNWSMMSGRFAGSFNFSSFVELVTDAEQSVAEQAASDINKVEPQYQQQQHKIKRPGKRRSLREDQDGSSDDFDESGEESAKKKRQQSITALQEKLHKMKVEIEQGGLVRMNLSEGPS